MKRRRLPPFGDFETEDGFGDFARFGDFDAFGDFDDPWDQREQDVTDV